MADIGTDFLTFLRANYPEDYDKISKDSVDDALVNAIISKHKAKFETWNKVPERIRDEYFGRVPDDILEAARTDNYLTVDEVRKIENDRNEENKMLFEIPLATGIIACEAAKYIKFSEKDKKDIYDKSLSLMQKGFKQEDSLTFAAYKYVRKQSQELLDNGSITKEAREEMLTMLKEKNQQAGRTYQIEHMPESALIRLFLDMGTGKVDKDAGLPMADELAKKVKEKGRVEELNKKLMYPQNKVVDKDIALLLNEFLISHNMNANAKNLSKTRSKMHNDNINTVKTMTIPTVNNAVQNFHPQTLNKHNINQRS